MWEESVKHCRAEPGTCSVPVPSRAAPRAYFSLGIRESAGKYRDRTFLNQSHIDIWCRKSSNSRAVPSTWQYTTSYYLIPTNLHGTVPDILALIPVPSILFYLLPSTSISIPFHSADTRQVRGAKFPHLAPTRLYLDSRLPATTGFSHTFSIVGKVAT